MPHIWKLDDPPHLGVFEEGAQPGELHRVYTDNAGDDLPCRAVCRIVAPSTLDAYVDRYGEYYRERYGASLRDVVVTTYYRGFSICEFEVLD
jgi:hypothetical protein